MDEHRLSNDRRQIIRRSIDRREKNISVNEDHRHGEKNRFMEERRKNNRRESWKFYNN